MSNMTVKEYMGLLPGRDTARSSLSYNLCNAYIDIMLDLARSYDRMRVPIATWRLAPSKAITGTSDTDKELARIVMVVAFVAEHHPVLFVINRDLQTIMVLNPSRDREPEALTALTQRIKDKMTRSEKRVYAVHDLAISYCTSPYDRGVYVCMYAWAIVNEKPLDGFIEGDMDAYRMLIARHITDRCFNWQSVSRAEQLKTVIPKTKP